MPRIDVPDGDNKITERVWQLRPEYAAAATAMLEATRHSILPPALREAVRFRIALINGCLLCQAYRAPGVLTSEQYGRVADAARASCFDDREQLAIEYAERFALDHHSMDDAFFDRLLPHFSDAEILDLTFFVGRFMAFGRLTHVLGLDDACQLPTAYADEADSFA